MAEKNAPRLKQGREEDGGEDDQWLGPCRKLLQGWHQQRIKRAPKKNGDEVDGEARRDGEEDDLQGYSTITKKLKLQCSDTM